LIGKYTVLGPGFSYQRVTAELVENKKNNRSCWLQFANQLTYFVTLDQSLHFQVFTVYSVKWG